MTDTPTTELSIYDCASAPTALSTGASPVTVDLGPRLYQITTGGTGATEEVLLPLPTTSLGGYVNDELIGLRITFSVLSQANPADSVKITPVDASLMGVVLPSVFHGPLVDSVVIDFEGACISFVWGADKWLIDTAITDGNYTLNYNDGAIIRLGNEQGSTRSDGDGIPAEMAGGNGTGAGQGGDCILTPGTGSGGSRAGVVISAWPTADPHVAGALWNNSGVLNVSAG